MTDSVFMLQNTWGIFPNTLAAKKLELKLHEKMLHHDPVLDPWDPYTHTRQHLSKEQAHWLKMPPELKKEAAQH